jgi:hypothetical protein
MAEPGRTPQPRPGATLTPGQQRTRERFETVIGAAAPFLDLVLAVGDRISRLAEPEDYEYYPVRSGERPPDKSETAQRGE